MRNSFAIIFFFVSAKVKSNQTHFFLFQLAMPCKKKAIWFLQDDIGSAKCHNHGNDVIDMMICMHQSSFAHNFNERYWVDNRIETVFRLTHCSPPTQNDTHSYIQKDTILVWFNCSHNQWAMWIWTFFANECGSLVFIVKLCIVLTSLQCYI